MKQKLILASASPQRKTLLDGLGWKFQVIPSHVPEHLHPEQDPMQRAIVLAELKAKDVESRYRGKGWIIGCDTLVVSPDGEVFEKPDNVEEARRMIRAQSGRTSIVHSGLAVIAPSGEMDTGVSSSDVRFGHLSDGDVEWWMGTGLWKGRSGAFQIDGPGQLLIEEISGDWTGIVGLPVYLLGGMLKASGFNPLR